MRWIAAAIAGVLGIAVAATAAGEPASFNQALQDARSGLTLSNGRLSGQGAQALSDAIAQARYVALGEDHLTREIPQFAAAVCDAMASHGLAAMAVETGPQVGKLMHPSLRTAPPPPR